MSKHTNRLSPSGPAPRVFHGSITLSGGETTANTILAPTGSAPTNSVIVGSPDLPGSFPQVGSVCCQRLTGGEIGVVVMFNAPASAGTLTLNATVLEGKVVSSD